MPTYEYKCRSCGQGLEVVQSFHDDPLTECPHCEGPLRKVFSPVGIVLSGGNVDLQTFGALLAGEPRRSQA